MSASSVRTKFSLQVKKNNGVLEKYLISFQKKMKNIYIIKNPTGSMYGMYTYI